MVQLSSTFKNIGQRLAGSHSYSVTSANIGALKRHSGFGIAGVFILLAILLLLAAAEMGTNPSKPAATRNASQSQPATNASSANLQINNSQASDLNSSQNPSTRSNDRSSSSVSTNVSSTTGADGQTSTSVTVNGQPVSVPANGSIHQQIGNAQVDASSTHSGTSSNLNVSSTDLNFDSSTDSSISTGGD